MVQSKHSPEMPPGKFERLEKAEIVLRPVVTRYYNGKANEDRSGYFHGWSHYTDEDGVSNPIGIIEWLDGTCTSRHVSDIKFTDR